MALVARSSRGRRGPRSGSGLGPGGRRLLCGVHDRRAAPLGRGRRGPAHRRCPAGVGARVRGRRRRHRVDRGWHHPAGTAGAGRAPCRDRVRRHLLRRGVRRIRHRPAPPVGAGRGVVVLPRARSPAWRAARWRWATPCHRCSGWARSSSSARSRRCCDRPGTPASAPVVASWHREPGLTLDRAACACVRRWSSGPSAAPRPPRGAEGALARRAVRDLDAARGQRARD